MTHLVGVVGGDGIGPEVIAEGLKVIAATGVALDTIDYDLGGSRYLRDGVILDDSTVDEWRGLDALYVGAVGTPILVGYLMEGFGASAFLFFIAVVMAAIAAYAVYRMTVRPAPVIEETSPISPYSTVSGTQATAEIAQEIAIEQISAEVNPG